MTARPHKAAEVRRRRKANPLAIRAHLAPSTAVLRCNSSVSGAFKGGFFASSRYEISLPARFRCLNALKNRLWTLKLATFGYKNVSWMAVAASLYSDIG